MASVMGLPLPPISAINSRRFRTHFALSFTELPAESGPLNEASTITVVEKNQNGSLVMEGSKVRGARVVEEKKSNDEGSASALAPLWDDGYGSRTVEDFFAAARELKDDGGPPRWFCPVECGRPLKNSPTLLFLPGKKSLLSHKVLKFFSFGLFCLL